MRPISCHLADTHRLIPSGRIHIAFVETDYGRDTGQYNCKQERRVKRTPETGVFGSSLSVCGRNLGFAVCVACEIFGFGLKKLLQMQLGMLPGVSENEHTPKSKLHEQRKLTCTKFSHCFGTLLRKSGLIIAVTPR